MSDERRQELDVILGLCVFSDKLLHGGIEFLKGLLDGAVAVLTTVILIVPLKPLLNGLHLFLRKLLVNRAQPSMFLLPASDFSSGRRFLLDLIVKLVLGKCLCNACCPRFLKIVKKMLRNSFSTKSFSYRLISWRSLRASSSVAAMSLGTTMSTVPMTCCSVCSMFWTNFVSIISVLS